MVSLRALFGKIASEASQIDRDTMGNYLLEKPQPISHSLL